MSITNCWLQWHLAANRNHFKECSSECQNVHKSVNKDGNLMSLYNLLITVSTFGLIQSQRSDHFAALAVFVICTAAQIYWLAGCLVFSVSNWLYRSMLWFPCLRYYY